MQNLKHLWPAFARSWIFGTASGGRHTLFPNPTVAVQELWNAEHPWHASAGNQDLQLRTVELSRKKGSPLSLLTGGGGASVTFQKLLQARPYAVTTSEKQALLHPIISTGASRKESWIS